MARLPTRKVRRRSVSVSRRTIVVCGYYPDLGIPAGCDNANSGVRVADQPVVKSMAMIKLERIFWPPMAIIFDFVSC